MERGKLNTKCVSLCHKMKAWHESGGRKGGREDRQRGFALLNVLIAVLILGTIATVAVPKFNAAMSAANTTKIQSDLAAIDTSIALYSIDKGAMPQKMSDLANYLENYDKITPPAGNCNIKGERAAVPAGGYSLVKGTDGNMHAQLGTYTIYDFGSKGGTGNETPDSNTNTGATGGN